MTTEFPAAAPSPGEAPAPAPASRGRLVVLGVALALRAGWAALVPVVPLSDSRAYDAFAWTLATHGVFGWTPDRPTAFWPPGTSFLYALLYRLFGHVYWPIVALNVALGVAVVALTLALATRWFGPRAGLVAGALVAVWPGQVEFTTVLASELPFTALLLATTLIFSRQPLRPRDALAAGVLLAAATYLRTTALLLPAVLGGCAAIRTRRLAPLGWAAVAAAVMAAGIAPWTVRNAALFHRLVLVSSNGGTNAWMGNNPGTTGEFMPPPYPPGMDEAEANEHLGHEARRYILEHPLRFVGRSAWKALRMHERESIGVTWNLGGLEPLGARGVLALKLLSNAFWWAVLPLGLAGLVGLVRRERWLAAAHPAVAVWAYFTAVHSVTVIQDRYHWPVAPLVAALAGAALASWRARRDHARVQA